MNTENELETLKIKYKASFRVISRLRIHLIENKEWVYNEVSFLVPELKGKRDVFESLLDDLEKGLMIHRIGNTHILLCCWGEHSKKTMREVQHILKSLGK